MARERDEDSDEGEGKAGGGFSLDRALSALRRRTALIAIITGLVAGMAATIVTLMPNRYDAASVVQVDPRRKSITNLEGIVSDLKADTATVESEVEMIRSRAISLRVIEVLNLRNDPEFTKPQGLLPNFKRAIKAMLGLKNAEDDDDDDRKGDKDPIAKLIDRPHEPASGLMTNGPPGASDPERDEVAVAFAERLRVLRVRNTLMIDIKFSASEATKAAKIANTIAEVYLDEQLRSKNQASGVAIKVLEEKLEVLRRKLTEADRRVEMFKAENGIFDTEGQILSEKQLARLMEQTIIARNASADARAKFEQVQRLRKQGDSGGNIADVLQSHTVRLLKEQLGKATRHEAELATRYGDRHPEMLKVRAEVADATAQLNTEIENLVNNLKNVMEEAASKERELAVNLANLKAQQVVSKEATVTLKELERDAATSKQLFEALLVRYKQTAETQGMQLPDSRIIERADVPLFPAAPKRAQLTIIATVGGLIAGMALVLLLEFGTRGIARPEDVEAALDAPHLSTLPRIVDGADQPVGAARELRYIVSDPNSLFADSIRNLRREVDLQRGGQPANILLVASSLPGEGAINVASNLAHHFALTGNRILLIDGDLRRAELTRQLAPARSTGLVEQLLRGDALEAAILKDQRTGLHLLPAKGPHRIETSYPELLSLPALRSGLVGLKTQFDTIIVAAPPLLPVLDARIWADQVDQTAFVIAWRRTPKQLAKKAISTLGPNQRKIIGVVLNETEPNFIAMPNWDVKSENSRPVFHRIFGMLSST